MKKLIIGILTIAAIALIINYAYTAVTGDVLLNIQDSSSTILKAVRVNDAGNISDNQTSGILPSGIMVYDGTNWDKWTGSVNISGGTITANQGTANTQANRWPVFLSNGTNEMGTSTNPLRIDPTGTTTQPISGTVTANAGTGNFNVIGNKTPSNAYANPTDAIVSYSLGGLYNGTTWDMERHSWNNISCNGVITTGPCTTIDISSHPMTKHTWTVVVTGSPTSVNVDLEGSIDNVNWFVLDSSTTTTQEMRHVVDKGVMYYRGNVTSLVGGTSPTVTVRIASFKD